MKIIYISLLLSFLAACSTPGAVTARPDPNVSTSGTLGSVKATNGPAPEQQARKNEMDSTQRKRDSTVHTPGM